MVRFVVIIPAEKKRDYDDIIIHIIYIPIGNEPIDF